MKINAFELEIFNNLLSSIAQEMGTVLIKSAFSPNIKERRDLSCALFNDKAEMIAQAAHIPVHLGSMSFAVKSVLKGLSLNEGDILILNDPFMGGTHLPDITIISPFYYKHKLQFFVAARAHHADIGGITPGSMPLSKSIYEEGILIPPSKLFDRNKLNKDLLDRILISTRDSEEREGDINAQIGAVKLGLQRLDEVIKKYSLYKIKAASSELIKYSNRIMCSVIADIKDGVYEYRDYLEDDGFGTQNIIIKVKIQINGEKAVIDFDGTSNQVKGCLNCPLSVTTSAVLYVFQCLAPRELPLNYGSLKPIKVVARKGSLLNASFPSAVAGGNVETSQRIVDVIFGALSEIIPKKIPAASSGSMNNVTFGNVKQSGESEFAYYETIAGGMGGRYGIEGISGIQTHMTNTLNTPIESLERELPMMIDSYSIRKRSGGSGKYKGGEGISRIYRMLSKTIVTIITERRKLSPYGLKGGKSGVRGINMVLKNNKLMRIPSKISLELDKGDILIIKTPGGGGWGSR